MTTTGRSCGRAHASTSASGIVSSVSPCITSVSRRTSGIGHLPAALPTSTRCLTGWCRAASVRATLAATKLPKENPASATAASLRYAFCDRGMRRNGFDQVQEVVRLAAPLVVDSFAAAHAPEIGTYRKPSDGGEGPCDGGGDLVFQRAAVQRMRMADIRDAARLSFRPVDRELDAPRGAINREFFRRRQHCRCQMRSRSTISPFTRCDSMISSISCSST
jgi:hypothetical protein